MNPDDPKTSQPAGVGGNPVARFWNWIKEKNKQEQEVQRKQTEELPGAIARGVSGAVIAGAQAVMEGAAAFDRYTGLGEAISPGYNATYDAQGGARGVAKNLTDPLKQAQDTHLGKRSDDMLVGFVEDAGQFLTGYMALSPLKAAKGASALVQYGAAAVRGAATDAAFFDPYEAQLAELAARSKVPGLEGLGELLSVKGDDTAIVARLKRSSAGAILGTTLDGLIAATRGLKARKALAGGKLTGAEKKAAEQTVTETDKVLEAIESGTSTPAAPIVVRANPDETATLIAQGQEGPTFPSKAEAQAQANTMNFASAPKEPADIPKLRASLKARLQGAVDAAGQVSDDVMDELADETLASLPTDQVTQVLTELSQDAGIQSAVNKMAQAHSRMLGRRIADLDIILEARPHDAVARQEAVERVQELLNFEDQRKWIVGEQGRALRLEGTKNGPKAPKEAPAGGGASAEAAPAGEAAGNTPDTVAGMATRDASRAAVDEANIRQITRMYRLAGGSPKDVTAAIQATNIIQKTGWSEKVLEFFTNALLSNPATVKTIALSGQMIQNFEALGRVGAGMATSNKALTQEGVDILFGNYMHLADNFRMARRALNEGQSVINPAPAHHAIGGTTGEIIRAPGSVALAGDEFTRTTNYRAFVRAKSLREGRAMGLSGEKLAAHLEADLRAAFDPETGIATIPEALQYAERSTLSGPLGLETVGGKFAAFIRDTPGVQFLAPFVKAGTNIFRFTTMHTPGLARLNREARAIMQAGGEEAAVLQTKQAMASAVYLTGAHLALSGNLTGDAPGDPALRDLWLADKQPYSVKIGDQWVSYRRTDPFGMMLGLTADFVQFGQQMDEQDPEMEQLAIAMTSALATGVLSPTYMKGMGDFLDAFADGSPSAIQKWTRQFGSSFVPAGLNTANADPYFREVRSMADAIKNRIPGLSQTLDPKYDMFGEPVLNGGVGNRSALFKTKDATPKVEAELAQLGRGFSPFQSVIRNVDLKDRETFDNGTGVSPYRRLMELIAEPKDGQTLRQRVEALVASERYQNASPGTADYPGGRRWDLVARERQRAFDRALRTVQQEYPKLREELRRVQRLERAAYRGGEEALTRAEELFGPRQQDRPLKSTKLQQR